MKKTFKFTIIFIYVLLFFTMIGCTKEEQSMKESLQQIEREETSENNILSKQERTETTTATNRTEWGYSNQQTEHEKISENDIDQNQSENIHHDVSISKENKNICPDCGYERLEIQCALCSGTGATASCERCKGTGIICRNCFYPPSYPPTSSPNTSNSLSNEKSSRLCSRCHGEGYTGTCFSCGGMGYTSHTEFYDSYGTGGTSYEVTRPCYLCKNGKQKCSLCNGTGFVNK